MFRVSKAAVRRMSSASTPAETSAWLAMKTYVRNMAPFYTVFGVLGGTFIAGGTIIGKMISLEEKSKTTEEKIKTARAESTYQAKTVPDEDDK
jgi:hypothetical protein